MKIYHIKDEYHFYKNAFVYGDILTLNKSINQNKIQKLKFFNCVFFETSIFDLIKLLKKTNIYDLKFSNCKTMKLLNLFDKLPKTKIKKLEITRESKFTIKYLFESLPHTKIEYLKIDSCPLNEVDIYKNIEKSKLKTLILCYCSLEDYNIKKISEILPQTKIEVLDLSSNKIKKEGANLLIESITKSKISKLNLFSNNIGTAKKFIKTLPKTKLTHLNIKCNGMLKKGYKLLIEKLPKTRITDFVFAYNMRQKIIFGNVFDSVVHNNKIKKYMIMFLFGLYEKHGKKSFIYKMSKSEIFEINLIKLIFSFLIKKVEFEY